MEQRQPSLQARAHRPLQEQVLNATAKGGWGVRGDHNVMAAGGGGVVRSQSKEQGHYRKVRRGGGSIEKVPAESDASANEGREAVALATRLGHTPVHGFASSFSMTDQPDLTRKCKYFMFCQFRG